MDGQKQLSIQKNWQQEDNAILGIVQNCKYPEHSSEKLQIFFRFNFMS